MELTPQQLDDIRLKNEIRERITVLSRWVDHRPLKKRSEKIPELELVPPVACRPPVDGDKLRL